MLTFKQYNTLTEGKEGKEGKEGDRVGIQHLQIGRAHV